MMNGYGKSDSPVVPEKSPNKARQQAAEGMEERGLAKRNPPECNAPRTQCRISTPSALERVRQAARKEKQRFTALFHHVAIEQLRSAYYEVKRNVAPGIDGETWRHYGENLEENLQNLSERLKRGAYRAKPVRRSYIPKADGRQRPIGLPVLEDRIVQRAVVEVLNAIYERDFLGFSYGFHGVPMNSQAIGAFRKKVNRLWFKVLKRRSDKHRLTWDRMNRLIARYIPVARICHPYPS